MTQENNSATITEKGDTVTVFPNSKPQTATYTFKNSYGNVIGEYTTGTPATLTSNSTVAKQIKELLDPEDKMKPSVLNKEFRSIKELLQLQYDNIILEQEQERILLQQEQTDKYNELLKKASTKLQEVEQPLIYIASLVDWITAGERNSVMFAFIVYAGQIILNNPISLICIGEASSGKSHIQTSALSLIPKKYIVNEKKITEPALFNRAKKDKFFYDGKIVNYGDMGGSNDHDFMEESKNLMKELQSDGYLNKPLSVPDGNGGWEVRDLELSGRPCLTYTTVPNHRFDDQELSRSIFITPRMDNNHIYYKMKSVLEYEFGKTAQTKKTYDNMLRLVPYMLLHLKQELSDVTIINPYVSFVNQYLGKSKYYKRDFPKYNGLLKTITALNYYNNIKTCINDQKVLFTSINDVQLFISLLEPYQESITANIAPKAIEVLNEIRENISKWTSKVNADDNLELDLGDSGITTNDYFNKSKLSLSKESVKQYIYDLADKGYLQVVGNKGRMNIYNLADSEFQVINNDLKQLSDSKNDLLVAELGEEIGELIFMEDKYIEGLSMTNQDANISKPSWVK